MGPRGGDYRWREPKKAKKGARKLEKVALPLAAPVEVIPKGKKRKAPEEEE